jgi:hypothetical protein
MQVLKMKNWKELIGNRKEWNNLVEKAKTHPGLLWWWWWRRRRKKKKNHNPDPQIPLKPICWYCSNTNLCTLGIASPGFLCCTRCCCTRSANLPCCASIDRNVQINSS